MIYCLLPSDHDEDDDHAQDDEHSEQFVTQKVNVFEELLERYNTIELCEQMLDQLLKDVNESIGARLNKRQVSTKTQNEQKGFGRNIKVNKM